MFSLWLATFFVSCIASVIIFEKEKKRRTLRCAAHRHPSSLSARSVIGF